MPGMVKLPAAPSAPKMRQHECGGLLTLHGFYVVYVINSVTCRFAVMQFGGKMRQCISYGLLISKYYHRRIQDFF